MDKSEQNKQFMTIKKKVWTFLNGHSFPVEKRRKPIETYSYIWDLAEQHAKSMDLDVTKYVEWYLFRGLSKSGYLKLDIEPKAYELMTAEELEMTEEQCNIQMRKMDYYRNKSRYSNALHT